MNAKRILTALLKPKAIVFGACIFIWVFVSYHEREIERFSGCWDCGWDSGSYLSNGCCYRTLDRKVMVCDHFIVASMKVLMTIGLVAFAENMREVKGVWPILRSSVRWSNESHPEFFVEIILALGIGVSSCWIICRLISERIHRRGIQQTLGADWPVSDLYS
jgi:hypothetical protein